MFSKCAAWVGGGWLVGMMLTASAMAANEVRPPIDSSVGKSPIGFSELAMMRPDLMNPVILPGTPPRLSDDNAALDPKQFFYIYRDRNALQNHFIPSGWMGDYGDLSIDDASREDPADGKTCFKITYRATVSQGFGWAGIYWQTPENNWGDKNGGFDLTGVKRLTFWARGAKGGEVIGEFKVGGIRGENEDSGSVRIGPITLSREWTHYVIDLADVDLSHIVGGFAWAASYDNNPNGMTFYLDEIRFER